SRAARCGLGKDDEVGVGMRSEIVDVEAGNKCACAERTRAGKEGWLRKDGRLGLGRTDAKQQAQQNEDKEETPPHRVEP
ncbi:MAG: hypothetical protein JNM40_15655, partial [Myxococcales bacterium]|nr:hypothetical protein [Myxococcales bacterium]